MSTPTDPSDPSMPSMPPPEHPDEPPVVFLPGDRPDASDGSGEEEQSGDATGHRQNSSTSRRCRTRVRRSERPKMITNQMTAIADG